MLGNTLTERLLSDFVADRGPLESKQALSVLTALAKQLAELHDSGQIHAAIDGRAISIGDDLLPKLSRPQPNRDGPGSGRPGSDGPERDFRIGPIPRAATLPPWPPEFRTRRVPCLPSDIEQAKEALQVAGIDADPRRIDLFQLGCVACELLSGDTQQSYLFSPRAKSRMPVAWRRLVEGLLGYDPTNRITTSAGLQSVLATMGVAPDELAASDTPPAGTGVDIEKNTPVEQRLAKGFPRPVDSAARGHEPAESESGVGCSPDDGALPFDRLGHYHIVGRVGRGGMGDIYRGYEPALDRRVALKVLPPELARQQDFVQRFVDEAKAAARLMHPNIVQIYFIGEDQGHHFFAMQLVEGESLAAKLAREGRLPLEVTLTIIEQVVSGLLVAHRQGMIHRDIKPSNILLDTQHDRALLADFGLVKSLDSSAQMTATGMVMGTVDYISPEQGRGKPVDTRSDLYSVGVLLYQMLSGRLPFTADSPTAMIFQHAYEAPRPLNELVHGISDSMGPIVHRLLAKDPADRYQSAGDLLADIRALRARPAVEPCERTDRPAANFASDRSVIITAPGFELADDEGQLAAALTSLSRAKWRSRLQAIFHWQVPESLKKLQNTQQQFDRALALYQTRRDDLAKLAHEARAIERELSAQLEAEKQFLARGRSELAGHDSSAAVRQSPHEHQAAIRSLAALLAEQQEQRADIEVRLAGMDATLHKLRSQEALLRARLQIAAADRSFAAADVPVASRVSARLLRGSRTAAARLVVGSVIVVGLFQIGSLVHQADSPVPTPVMEHQEPLALASNLQGQFFVACKGEFVLEVNGAPVFSSDPLVRGIGGSELVELREGDLLVVRVKSKFVYRAIRFAFVTADGNHLWSARREQFRVLDDAVPPEAVDDDWWNRLEGVPTVGRADDRWQSRWNDFAVADSSDWMWAGGKNEWSQFATIIRRDMFEPNVPVLVSDQWEWTPPENAGPVVNSSGGDGGPFVTADGLTLLFHSNREGGFGGTDLWMSQRLSPQAMWGNPVNLGPEINGGHDDQFPNMTADGLTFVFRSNRPGGVGHHDIYASTRDEVGAPWSPPVNLGPRVNYDDAESSPSISWDGRTLLFSSRHPGGAGQSDLWMSRRNDPRGAWGEPENLGAINSPQNDSAPTLSADGRVLIFSSSRSGSSGGEDIWMTSRPNATAAFGVPVNLGPVVNSRSRDGNTHLSADGRTLWFGSYRPGGSGGYDLWFTRRIRKQTAPGLAAATSATSPATLGSITSRRAE